MRWRGFVVGLLLVAAHLSGAAAQSGSLSCSDLGWRYESGTLVWNGFRVNAVVSYDAPGSGTSISRVTLSPGPLTCSSGFPDGSNRCQNAVANGAATSAGYKVTFAGGGTYDSFNECGLSPGYDDNMALHTTCAQPPPCPPGGSGCVYSPIVVPMKQRTWQGRGAEIGGPEEAVNFDVNGDGVVERTTWPRPGTMLLAIDSNNNGIIDDGNELFGNAGSYANGFEKLLALAAQPHGFLSSGNPLWASLKLWDDADADGVTDSGELRSISSTLEGIGLSYDGETSQDEHGNRFWKKGWAEFKQPGARNVNVFGYDESAVYPIYDVAFVVVP